ncbi:MAG: tetratricopeptide repeat protein [Candidatus Levybacteria bacterium]|nr:tetratricopeptide repeat protein [Candidatus Levybacteria bacterium]
MAERLVHIPNIIFYYLKTFLLPFHLTIEQRWIIKTTTGNNFYLPLLIDTLFFLFFIVIGRFVWKKDRKAFRIFVLFSFWFIAGIFMLLQVFPLDMTVADRWFYFPMVGLLGMIGISMQAIMGKISRKNMYIGYGIAISIILLLSLRTIVRNANWVNAITLYSHDSKIYDNDEIENNLGNEYYAEHNYREALRHFKKSVELYPNATNLSNLGSIYEIFNDKASARKYFYMILNTDAYSKNTYDYFLVYASSVLLHSDSPEIANDFTYKALKKAPHTGYLWANKAISEYKQLNQKEALAAAERAKSLTPNAQTNYLYTLISEEKEIPEDMVFQLQ